ncbi:hypothetical protein BVRB_2g043320 [Beta vulgaris subsp. vulgaris]|nr:hypothetical protein BVRB_2g043320 [Beta vulgaris subsp. vulgaris]
MRQTSSFSLHRISAAMSTTTRPPFRGGRARGRRSFSDRPSTTVSGDSHFQSVRDSNFRATNNFNNNNNNYHHHNLNSSSNFGTFKSRNYSNGEYSFNRRHNQPSGARVQRPKPPDFRSWEFAKLPPPPHDERFVLLSYNILADYLANSHRKLYFHIPRRFMSWDWRKGNILFELRLWSPDIMCLQEVDKFHELEEDFRVRGYSGIWKMRTGDPIDGCAIFWRTSRFRLMYEECIEFNKHGMRDNVAQICVLESLVPNQSEKELASSSSSKGPNRVVICNTHVLYNPRRGEIKLGQVRILLERAQAVSKTWDDAPAVLCGDFNCTPMSPLYNFISEQKLDISEVERDKVSGQASAVIYPPPRQYDPQPREQPTGDVASPTIAQNNSIGRKQSDSCENVNDIESSSEPLVSLQGPPSVDPLLNASLNSFEKKRGLSQSTDSLKDSHGDQTKLRADEIGSAKSADAIINETMKGQEVTLSEKGIGSCLPLKEQETKKDLISEESSWSGHSGRLSSVTDDSDKNIVVKEARVNYNSQMSQSENSLRSSSESVEVNMLGSINDPSPPSICEASDQNTSSGSIDEKIIGLSLNEMEEPLEDDKALDEDGEESLSDLTNGEGALPSNLGDLVPEDNTVDVDTFSYDPSLWTPMEIATATGDASSSALEHSLKLKSTYSEVVDSSGTRDSNGEPLVTSYNTCFMGTVDYIWRSEGLCTIKVLAPITKDAMQPSGGFPTKKWGSDHIALASELAFTKK